MAKLVPFSTIVGTEEELLLVAAGKMRLPEGPVDPEKVLRVPTANTLAARERLLCLKIGNNRYEQATCLLGLERAGGTMCA